MSVTRAAFAISLVLGCLPLAVVLTACCRAAVYVVDLLFAFDVIYLSRVSSNPATAVVSISSLDHFWSGLRLQFKRLNRCLSAADLTDHAAEV